MRCIICRKGPSDGVGLVRINAKGQPGVWACLRHRSHTDAPHDPELTRIVSIIESRQP